MSNTTLHRPEASLAYASIYGCIMAIGLPLNAVSLLTLIRRHSLRSPSAVFMINLAISDLLLVIFLPMRIYVFATGSWPLGITACTWITMFFRDNIRSSAIFITLISTDRLLAVVYPLRSRHLRSISNAWKVCAFVWLLILVCSVPEGMGFSACMTEFNTTFCFVLPECSKTKLFSYLQYIIVFSLLAVNVVTTAMVSWTLHGHFNNSLRVNKKMNVMLIFAMNWLMFILFFLPLSVAVLYTDWRPAIQPTTCIASMNCCFDPLLYYFSLDAFWKKKDNADSSLQLRQ